MLCPSESTWVSFVFKNFCNRFEHCVVVESKEAKFLFDTMINLPLFGGRERVSALRRDPDQIHYKDTASQIPMKDGVRQSVIL